MQNATDRAGQAFAKARENDYVRRMVEDEELRASLIAAAMAGRKAVQRISSNRASAVESVTSDRKVKRELRAAADSLRDAAERIKAPPKKRRHPIRNLVLVALITGGVVLVVSESARNAVLDAIFGAEEEFVYTSQTSGAPETNGAPVAE